MSIVFSGSEIVRHEENSRLKAHEFRDYFQYIINPHTLQPEKKYDQLSLVN